MRPYRFQLVLFFCLLFLLQASAATLYVSLNSTNPVPPYADWSTAATNIQDAIDASTNGDLILVTNGVYQTGGRPDEYGRSNRVAVTKAVAVESVNGPGVTMIVGNGNAVTAYVRCVYLTNDAVLLGFTLTNGCPSPTPEGSSYGGGVRCATSSSVLSNCVLTGNSAFAGGGGAYGGTLYSCLLIGNQNSGAYDSILNNCLVVSNSAGSMGGGTWGCTLTNCTVTRNTGGGVAAGYFNNCIIYYNDHNFDLNDKLVAYFNTCDTTPAPDPSIAYLVINVITNEPLFVNTNDFHLQSNSPCINSGNNTLVVGATDLDGNPRIVAGMVDIGAYEYQTPVSKISYAWLEQYGLPINTNADTSDADGDGLNNYQEWIAGTNPTNALSVLAVLPPVPTNNPAGLVVGWQSVNNRTYFLQSSTNLGAQPAFSTIQSNIAGQTGTTSYTDTNDIGNGPFFYRVGVQ